MSKKIIRIEFLSENEWFPIKTFPSKKVRQEWKDAKKETDRLNKEGYTKYRAIEDNGKGSIKIHGYQGTNHAVTTIRSPSSP